jgi:phosphotriesterase-related protein
MVNTVLGSISSTELGRTLMHEHFVFGFPGFSGDTTLGGYNRNIAFDSAISMVKRLKKYGVQTIVDPTPNDCGRDPELLRDISQKTGINIICATGYYYEGAGATTYFKYRNCYTDVETEIYEMFMTEIQEGIGSSGIKAGIIKLASSFNKITDYERVFFKAAARVHKKTGVVILTHTTQGTMGPEQAELLISEGVDPKRIVIGHMCGNADLTYQINTLQKGVHIGFDQFGIQGILNANLDSTRLKCLITLINMGYKKRLLLSTDSIILKLGRPMPYPEEIRRLLLNSHAAHLFENILPYLEDQGFNDEYTNIFLNTNPMSLFA